MIFNSSQDMLAITSENITDPREKQRSGISYMYIYTHMCICMCECIHICKLGLNLEKYKCFILCSHFNIRVPVFNDHIYHRNSKHYQNKYEIWINSICGISTLKGNDVCMCVYRILFCFNSAMHWCSYMYLEFYVYLSICMFDIM